MIITISAGIACLLFMAYCVCAVQMSIEKELKNVHEETDSLGFCIAELRRELDKLKQEKQKKQKANVIKDEQGTLI